VTVRQALACAVTLQLRHCQLRTRLPGPSFGGSILGLVCLREALKEQCLVWNFTSEGSVREAGAVLGFGSAWEEAPACGDSGS